jgi:hypothetical protein
MMRSPLDEGPGEITIKALAKDPEAYQDPKVFPDLKVFEPFERFIGIHMSCRFSSVAA